MTINFIVFLALLLCDFTSGARKAKYSFRRGNGSLRRPNIIFILLDDMDSELGSSDVMKKTQKILRQEGANFVNAFVTSPMCCPSRSSILTGKYAHNHHTFTNNLNCSSPSWRKGPERKTYARYLELAGYVTGHFGKYLNEYDGSWVPVGWKKWEGLRFNSRFYNYVIRHNTYMERHGMSYEEDYFTDFITNRSISFIKRTVATRPKSPFLAVISHAAPHGPETSAPQYSTAFPDVKAPRIPNWNFISLDKQWILRQKKPMDAQKIAFVDLLHRRRLQTLLSVDDSVARIFSTLQSLGIENETYILLSSDHGYHLGQFGLVKGKSMPFESDIRVPFYFRGPTVPKNIRMKEMVLNIDIAPTFLDIAGVTVPKDMDGTSIMKLFRKKKDGRRSKRRMRGVWRDTFLIERSRGWRRTKTLLDGAGLPSKFSTKEKSANKTQTNRERKMTILENICTSPKHQSPCKPKQLWECLIVGGRFRLKKCRKSDLIRATRTPTTRPTTSPASTTPVKMCVCMKPRRGNQGDMLPNYEKLLRNELDYFSTKELRRRSKRSRYSYVGERLRRSTSEFNVRRYYKELARAQRLQNRRSKSKMLRKTAVTGIKHRPNASESLIGPGVQAVVEEKLGKLKEKIWEIRMRLGALRDRKKKLLMISGRDRMIEYPCPCNRGNSTKSERVTEARVHNEGKGADRDGDGEDDDDDDNENNDNDDNSQISFLKRINKQPEAVSRKVEVKQKTKKKKKGKTKLRRSYCRSPGLNCFYQTNDHWKLPPLWTGGDFCFCPNAANNSYWCLRTINSTHNFLYCEFITNFLEFFDLNQDPYQLYNVVDRVSPAVLSQLHEQLDRMRACRGAHQCNHYHGKKYVQINATSVPLTTSLLTSKSKETQKTMNITTDGESGVHDNESTAVLGITKSMHLPTISSTLRTSSELVSSPLPSGNVSEELGNLSQGVLNTTESALDSTEATKSSKVPFTSTLTPTEKGKVREEAKTTQNLSESCGSYSGSVQSVNKTNVDISKEREFTTTVSPLTTVDTLKTRQTQPTSTDPAVIVKTSEPSSSPSISEEHGKPSQGIASTSTPVVKGGRKKDKNGKKVKTKGKKKSRKSAKKWKNLTLPAKSDIQDKATKMPTTIPNEFNGNANKDSKYENATEVSTKKISESTIALTTSPDYLPTLLLTTSKQEPSFSETAVATKHPTYLATISNEESTEQIDLTEYSTVKPTQKISTKRRKNKGKNNLRKNKKLRKTKKKAGKGLKKSTNISTSAEVVKLPVNQTAIETKPESERSASGQAKVTKEKNTPLAENSKKRNKKPSGKRSNRNSKKRFRKPSYRTTPSSSSADRGGTGGEIVTPAGGGGGKFSPSDP